MKSTTVTSRSPVTDLLGKIHESLKTLTDGTVASYIPELAVSPAPLKNQLGLFFVFSTFSLTTFPLAFRQCLV